MADDEALSEEEKRRLFYRERERAYSRQRAARKHPVRPRTEKLGRATKHQLTVLHEENTEIEPYSRPATRSECVGSVRPCLYISCRFNLFLDVHPTTGSIKLNFPDLEPEQMKTSCVLDVVDAGGATLEEVGALLNLTRERVRQIEEMGKKVLKPQLRRRGISSGQMEGSEMPSTGEQMESLADADGGEGGEEPVDKEGLEVIRWANEVYAEMKRVGLRRALALASESTENLGEEDPPL